MTKYLVLLFLFSVFFIHFKATGSGSKVITGLKAEGRQGWIVTDETEIRLSWQVRQKSVANPVAGYEMIASRTEEDALKGIGSLWDSGFLPVENGPWVNFSTGGIPSRTQVWWRVRPVFSNSETGQWSEIATFETGLKYETGRKGKWIGMDPEQRQHSAPWFRKGFSLEKPVIRARLYVCGPGWHESYLNGKRLGNEVLQPAQTDYDQRLFYVAHDVTRFLSAGQNVVGIWTGDGFFNQDRVWGIRGMSYGEPRVLCLLEITHTDRSMTVIKTDETWSCKKSPVIQSNVYAGEEYDSRMEDPGWSSPGGTEADWQPVVVMDSPGGKLVAQELPPCRRKGINGVKSVEEIRNGVFIFDFGQNMVGWAKLKVKATPGTKITLRFAEERLPSEELNFATGGVEATKVIQTDVYVCRGNRTEIWEPRFTCHGFRYAEMTVSEGRLMTGPDKYLLEGVVVHTDMESAGEFSCSDETLNQAWQMAYHTQVGNMLGVPTDCPVRERCGWTGDAHLTVPFTMYQFDAASFWKKYSSDIVTTAQRTGTMLCFGKNKGERKPGIKAPGIPTMVAPGMRFIGEASPEWGSALVFIPWEIYLFTGDRRLIERNYESMKQWTNHLTDLSDSHIVHPGMGDWCKPWNDTGGNRNNAREYYAEVTPMLSTACYYRCLGILSKCAHLLGREEDENTFSTLAGLVSRAFYNSFYSENRFMEPDQTINALAVAWNILPEEQHPRVAARLAEQVREAGYHFMTGVFGLPSVWPVLCRFGHGETAWKALQSDTSPSIRYLLKRGATTFWEVWPTESDGNLVYTRSMSHPFQGAFVSWFYSGLAGISYDLNNPGFRKILFEPQLIKGLEWVNCRYLSTMGTIVSSWEIRNSFFTWNLEIPPGAAGQLKVPGKLVKIKSYTKTEIPLPATETAPVIELPSGKYTVVSSLLNQ